MASAADGGGGGGDWPAAGAARLDGLDEPLALEVELGEPIGLGPAFMAALPSAPGGGGLVGGRGEDGQPRPLAELGDREASGGWG